MRRKERQVFDIEKIKKILEKSFVLHLGFCDEGKCYVVPVNFGFSFEDEKLTIYFHGAREGRKFSLIQKEPVVFFECECDEKLVEGEKACDYSALYSCVMGEGKVSEIKIPDEKKTGLNLIMKKATGKENWTFPEIMLGRVGVFKIEVESFTCKIH